MSFYIAIILYFLGAFSFSLWDEILFSLKSKDISVFLVSILMIIFWPFVMIYALFYTVYESIRNFRD